MEQVDTYRHFATQCAELAGKAQAPNDRTVLLEMALHWSRLAEYAIKQRGALVPETANRSTEQSRDK